MLLAIALLVLGLALVVAEVFFPSLGFLTLIAGAALIGSVVAAFHVSTIFFVGILIAAIAGLPLTFFFAFRFFPRTPFGKRMINPGSDFKKEERAAVEHAAARFVGQFGQAQSLLRPTGIAMFGEERLDVVTRGEHLEPGTPVKAVRFVGNRLVVEQAHQTEVETQES